MKLLIVLSLVALSLGQIQKYKFYDHYEPKVKIYEPLDVKVKPFGAIDTKFKYYEPPREEIKVKVYEPFEHKLFKPLEAVKYLSVPKKTQTYVEPLSVKYVDLKKEERRVEPFGAKAYETLKIKYHDSPYEPKDLDDKFGPIVAPLKLVEPYGAHKIYEKLAPAYEPITSHKLIHSYPSYPSYPSYSSYPYGLDGVLGGTGGYKYVVVGDQRPVTSAGWLSVPAYDDKKIIIKKEMKDREVEELIIPDHKEIVIEQKPENILIRKEPQITHLYKDSDLLYPGKPEGILPFDGSAYYY